MIITRPELKGFTLVELIIVIVLLGTISAITLPRFFDEQTFTSSFERSELDNAIAWTRNRTVTSQCTHELRITDTGWNVYRDVDCRTSPPLTAIEAACTAGSEVLDLSVAVSDSLGSTVAGTSPTVATANSPQRLIFTATGQLFLMTAAPTVSGCTTLPTNYAPAGSTITLIPAATLSFDGATAYAEIN